MRASPRGEARAGRLHVIGLALLWMAAGAPGRHAGADEDPPVKTPDPNASLRASVKMEAPPPAGSAKAGEGVLDSGEIKKVVKAHLREVAGCYERRLVKDTTLAGRIVLAWVILPTGEVGEVKVPFSSVKDPEVASCIQAAVKRWTFPAPTGGSVTITYPFVLGSAEYSPAPPALGPPPLNDPDALRAEARRLPARLPVLPFRSDPMFPGQIIPIEAGRPESVAAIDQALSATGGVIVILAQRAADDLRPIDDGLYGTGCAVRLKYPKRNAAGHYEALAIGITRVRITAIEQREPFREAAIVAEPDPPATPELIAMADKLRRQAAAPRPAYVPAGAMASAVKDPLMFCDLLAATLAAPREVKQRVLEILDPADRMQQVSRMLPALPAAGQITASDTSR